MKKLALALASATMLISAPALAADLGRMPVKAPVAYAPTYFSWNGFYIGGNVGWGFGDNDVRVAPSPDALSQAFWNPAFNAGAVPSLHSLKPEGFVGGGQIGYNVQNGMWVFGLEADFQGADIRDTSTINTAVAGFVPITATATQSLDWFGTVRGRLGVAAGTALFYVTGGLAYGDVKYNYSMAAPGSNDFQNLSRSSTDVGYTVGGGIEWAFNNNWSVKAEYLFLDLGNQSFTTVGTGRAANVATSFTTNFDNQYHVARIGLNYRFGGGPIMASY